MKNQNGGYKSCAFGSPKLEILEDNKSKTFGSPKLEILEEDKNGSNNNHDLQDVSRD